MPRPSPQTERLVHVVELLAASGREGRTLAELARSLGVDKSTCLPMLSELVRVGWLIRNPRRKTFHLGPRLAVVGQAAQHAVDVMDLARPALADLADRAGVTGFAVSASGSDLVVLDVVAPRNSSARVARALGMRAGDRIGFRPPLGAVLALWGEPGETEEWLRRVPPRMQAEGSEADLSDVLDVIRRRGFAVEEYRPSPDELAVSVNRAAGQLFGSRRTAALLSDQLERMTLDVLVGELDPRREYWGVSINAPVLNSKDVAVLALCLIDPVGPLSGPRIIELGEMIASTASEVGNQLGAASNELSDSTPLTATRP